MSEKYVEFLSQISLFMDLQSDDLVKIGPIMVEEKFKTGDIVIAEGVLPRAWSVRTLQHAPTFKNYKAGWSPPS